VADAADNGSVELGVKFRSDISGFITGIRFYKGPTNTGTHVGSLWNSSGTLLASVTFISESASGWQQVSFANPVPVTAGATYVASYHTNVGQYSYTSAYFTSAGTDSGPLHALANGVSGGNGVYNYSAASSFPTSSFNSANYWVDVVFNVTPPAPNVASESPAPGAANVAPTTPVSVVFNVSVQTASISFTLRDAANQVVPSIVSYNDATHTATLTPSARLSALTTYTATVSGAKDQSGNPMPSPFVWSFTTAPNQFAQTTTADFSGDALVNTLVANGAGGEVALAQSLDDFTGTTLSATWTTISWASAGGGPASVAVAASVASIGGAEVLSGTITRGTPLEAMMAFGATAYQHFGLATDFAAVGGNYWAMFSTMGTTNTLFARLNISGSTQDVSIGALPSGFHSYLIKPISGGFEFYVDNVLKTTLSGTVPTAIGLKAAFSSFNGAPQSPLQVDWIRYGGYLTSGTLTSSVYDAGQLAHWASATWTATLPTGTTLTVQTRSGNTATPDATWSPYQTVINGGAVASPAGRYIQYVVTFTTTDPSVTPILSDLVISWS
jgi:hypothetical protein